MVRLHKKKDKQESTSTIPEEVQEFVNLTITEHMGKAYSEWKLNQDKEEVSEIDKKYQEWTIAVRVQSEIYNNAHIQVAGQQLTVCGRSSYVGVLFLRTRTGKPLRG